MYANQLCNAEGIDFMAEDWTWLKSEMVTWCYQIILVFNELDTYTIEHHSHFFFLLDM